VKVLLLQQYDLALKLNVSLNCCDLSKSYRPKHLLKIFFDRRWSPDRLKTVATSVIFVVVVVCGRQQHIH